MTRPKDPLEYAAMLIVLEASQTSTAATRCVRVSLIKDLAAALRARGWNVDAGLARVKEINKQRRREALARRPQLEKEQREREAEFSRRFAEAALARAKEAQ